MTFRCHKTQEIQALRLDLRTATASDPRRQHAAATAGAVQLFGLTPFDAASGFWHRNCSVTPLNTNYAGK